ncbi:MFS transporter [Spongiactinospora sp. TRM90649]|uniref:MFS transporter n=1 Tax=Spongiactinospora sp. TRM90649 TaxID=3031114 RepID=UPI0023F61D57|nr:MFS transporter [Spongiactinospora sp. TRM90649]MDF5751811.1 MFS transporter [Spongiactinospora sp. TRM90649]
MAEHNTGAREGRSATGGAVLVALGTQQLLMAYDSTAMNVAVSAIVKDLGTTLSGVQSAISVYALIMAAMMITGSKLGTRHGHVRMFTLGAAIYGLGALVTSMSPSLVVMMIGWSLLEGVGAALVFPAILSVATQMFTGRERTRALTIVGAAAGVGAALGPLIGGLITTYLSWRVSFLMETLVTATVIVLMRRAREPKRGHLAESFDLTGVALSALTFTTIVLGVLVSGVYGLVTARRDVVVGGHTLLREGDVSPTVILLACGVVLFCVFAWWERRLVGLGRDPLVRLAVLRDRPIRVGSLALGAQFLVTAGLMFQIPVFLQTTLGYDALQSGLTLLPLSALLILGAMAATRLLGAGRVTRRTLVVYGFLLLAAGSVLIGLTFNPQGSGLWLAPGLAVAGVGMGCCTILSDLVQSAARPDEVSDVAGLSRSLSYLGQSVGVALAGALMTAVLLWTFTAGVDASGVFPPAQKSAIISTVETGVQVTAVSDEQLQAALAHRGLSSQAEAEIVRINAEARERALEAAVLGMAVFALIGFGLALCLPMAGTRCY